MISTINNLTSPYRVVRHQGPRLLRGQERWQDACQPYPGSQWVETFFHQKCLHSPSENANDSLKGRVVELSLADLNNDQEQSFRKIKLRVEDVSGKNCLTSFYGMDFTTDKIRSIVRKWQTLIEASVDVRTTDGYVLRLFAIGFTKRAFNQVKKTTYAKSSQVREIRAKMVEIMRREAEGSELKELVAKFVPESIGREIEKATKGVYPLHNVYVRKAKILKTPKLDLSKLLENHGEATDASGSKVVKSGDFVEPEILASV